MSTNLLEATQWGSNALLAKNTLEMKATKGIPTVGGHIMDIPLLEELAKSPAGSYVQNPEEVYLKFKKNIGACFIDQYIPRNPLTMGQTGYDDSHARSASAGLDKIIRDGIEINSPEAVAEHMEKFIFPELNRKIKNFSKDNQHKIKDLVEQENEIQTEFGNNILKIPYSGGFQSFPKMRYTQYGYENYFMAYALFPELIEKDFELQGILAKKNNALSAQAIIEGDLPRQIRFDHDMADSRGTLVNIKTLDKIWFPHFNKCIQPFHDADIRIIWHCDGNLMQMVPRLIESGIGGFQGFQYEDGMDYESICKMKTREGNSLFIWAGVSVTTTLPSGTIQDVKDQLKWLVNHGPKVGLTLGASSSITPGTNAENIKTFIEGLNHYRINGRN